MLKKRFLQMAFNVKEQRRTVFCFGAVLFLSLFFCRTRAEATIIGFDCSGENETCIGHSVYFEDGYRIVASPFSGIPGEVQLLQNTCGLNGCFDAGFAIPNFGFDDHSLILTKSDSGTFDLLSIDLGEFHSTSDTVRLRVTGVRADSTTVTTTKTLDGTFGVQRFTFIGFTNLVSVTFGGVDAASNLIIVDQIVVQASTTVCVPPVGKRPTFVFPEFPRCNALNYISSCLEKRDIDGNGESDCLFYELEDDGKNKLQLWCMLDLFTDGEDFLWYSFLYLPQGEEEKFAGKCPYEEGRNELKILHSGDNDFNEKPDCFIGSQWTSLDTNKDDDADGLVDWMVYDFKVSTFLTRSINYQSVDGQGPPLPDQVAAMDVRDPAPRFNDLPPFIDIDNIPRGGEMAKSDRRPCDFNLDGACNAGDEAVFNQSMGACLGQPNFDSRADIDGNLCINADDQFLLFESDGDGDGVIDSLDNCSLIPNQNQADIDHDGIGDACDDPFTFTGFFAPVDNNGILNQAKAGQAVPVKWLVLDASGAPISDPASFVSLTSSQVACSTLSGGTDEVEEYTAGSSGLQYLGEGNWQFNWKTPKTYAGQCRVMRLNLADEAGNTSTRTANFKFK